MAQTGTGGGGEGRGFFDRANRSVEVASHGNTGAVERAHCSEVGIGVGSGNLTTVTVPGDERGVHAVDGIALSAARRSLEVEEVVVAHAHEPSVTAGSAETGGKGPSAAHEMYSEEYSDSSESSSDSDTDSSEAAAQISASLAIPSQLEADAKAKANIAVPIHAPTLCTANFEPSGDFQDPDSHPVPVATISAMVLDITVVHAEGLNDFYIKPAPSCSSHGNLTLLHENMAKCYNDVRSAAYCTPTMENLAKSGHFAALVETIQEWRRVVVRGWTNDGEITVQLLDDGGTLIVRIDNLRFLRKVFCTLPVQAHHAKFQMVDSETWTAEETDLFKLDTNGKDFFAVILKDTEDLDFSPFRTVGVALLQTDNVQDSAITSIYTFGGRLQFGYALEVKPAASGGPSLKTFTNP